MNYEKNTFSQQNANTGSLNDRDIGKIRDSLKFLSNSAGMYTYFYILAGIICVITALFTVHFSRSFEDPSQIYKICGCLFIGLFVAVAASAVWFIRAPKSLPDYQKVVEYSTKKYTGTDKIKMYAATLVGGAVFVAGAGFLIFFHSKLLTYVVTFIVLVILFANLFILNSRFKKAARCASQYPEITDKISHEYPAYILNQAKRAPIRAILAVIGVLLGIVIFCLSAYLPVNKYSSFKMGKICIGDNIGYISRMLGEPYDKSNLGEDINDTSNGVWSWCSSPLAKKIAAKTKQLEKLTEKENLTDKDAELMGKLLEDIMNLELELANETYDLIRVTYERNKVTYISLKKDYCEVADAKELSVKNITYAVDNGLSSGLFKSNKYYSYRNALTVSDRNIDQSSKKIEINAREYLSDGSITNKPIKIDFDEIWSGEKAFVWTDEYGSHTVNLTYQN